MMSNCDVTNSTPNTNDHHMTLKQTPPINFLRTPLTTAHVVAWFVSELPDENVFAKQVP